MDFRKRKTQTVLVTPELARKWLGWNVNNRELNPDEVEKIATLMKEGKWVQPDETIDFLHNGILVNGQHRLNAIIKAGIPVKIQINTCVDRGSFLKRDIHGNVYFDKNP